MDKYSNGMKVEASVTGTIFSQHLDVESYEAARIRLNKEFPESQNCSLNTGITSKLKPITHLLTISFSKLILCAQAASAWRNCMGFIQLQNLVKNGPNTVAAMRSVAILYSKPEEVVAELDALREIVRQADYTNGYLNGS